MVSEREVTGDAELPDKYGSRYVAKEVNGENRFLHETTYYFPEF
jgi:hypothetical protein